jgi:exopolysaccharide biosynthesis polyprenyl glycosylphosphotransferase
MNSGRNVYLVDTPVFKVNNFGPSQLEKIIKRLFDIFFSLFFLILVSPILLITAIAIKAGDGGPVFYKQVRLTQYGKPFKIIKFRSMRVDAEKDGKAQLAKENDDRITPVGKFIRSCRIDELPQLINILSGDMSVVGPRPERPELIEKIKLEVPEFDYRLGVKAGLTGYAQVYGKYNTRLKDKLLFDLIYIEQFSVLLDLRIMFMTFKILFKKDSTEGVSD